MVGLEEPSVVVTEGKRGRMPIGKAGPGGTSRPALTAHAVTRRDRHRIGGLADRDRERLQAKQPCRRRPVFAAGEQHLEERQAAGRVDSMPGAVLDQDPPGHRRSRLHRPRWQYHPRRHRRRGAARRRRRRMHACGWARGSTVGTPRRDGTAARTPCRHKRQHDEECPHVKSDAARPHPVPTGISPHRQPAQHCCPTCEFGAHHPTACNRLGSPASRDYTGPYRRQRRSSSRWRAAGAAR
jgi:hypothetical protein